MKNVCIILSFTAILTFEIPLFSQGVSSDDSSQDRSLRTQFQEMVDKAESYNEYKVVKRATLNQFLKNVQDSIAVNRNQINSLTNQVEDQKQQIRQLSTRISDLETQLAESESLRESLSFLGIQFNKTTYHTIVWIIIAALAVFGAFAYISFMRSNSITTKTVKELKALELQFEEHRKTSHEKQLKLGRELQTERNLVEELKNQLKSKPASKI